MADLTERPATELIELLRAGQISSVELCEQFFARIDLVNPSLQALVVDLRVEARQAATAADAQRRSGHATGLLHGLPITIKEMFDLEGTPTTAGISRLRSTLARQDAPVVARLRQAGAILLGKTNVPQLGIMAESVNPVYGTTNNPWDLRRSPGGSSGGEAALIAAGGSPLGLGSDGGGSIRQPAHVCGICGFKPTGGRLTMQGHWLASNWPFDWAQPGPMARHVDDLVLGLRAMECPQPTRPSYGEWPFPIGPLDAVPRRGLRIGVYEQLPDLPVVPAVRRGLQIAATALRDAGIEVVPFPLPVPESYWECFQVLLYAEGLRDMRRQLLGSPIDPRVKQFLTFARLPTWIRPFAAWTMDRLGQPRIAKTLRTIRHTTLKAEDLCRWQQKMHALRMTMSRAMDRHQLDAILCPAHPVPAWPHDQFYANEAMQYTAIYNLLAMPAGVVPVTSVEENESNTLPDAGERVAKSLHAADRASTGLPIGIQLVGRWWRDELVLGLMKIVETHVRHSRSFCSQLPKVGMATASRRESSS